ncbi:MAG: alginate lyase family protein [Ilumatobacteraceae bacterium]
MRGTTMTSARVDAMAPQSVICVIDHLHRDLTIADAARHGRFTHAGVELDLGRRPDWINGGLAGDVEWRIEWVKFYEGLDLAHAYSITGDVDHLAAWEDLVEAFCDQVGVGADVADVSARRLQNWLYAWRRFADAPHFTGLRPGLADRLTQRILRDADHLRSHLTAQRNHRTLELYALLIVGLSLPDDLDTLARFALDQLGENLLTDVWSDGVHRECSTDYHCIALRSYLGGIANARAAGLELPDGYLERVSLALDFALHIQRPDGLTPSFSDGDTADFRGLLALGAELLDRDDLRWAATGGNAGVPPATVDATFPVGGYLTSRSGWGAGSAAYDDERFMLMDVGPIGDGGHGHYDQLSMELYARGHSLIVDPGRFTYADTPWRHWFKGSKAHNTVTIDGLDQTPYRHGSTKKATSHARLIRRVSRQDLDAIEAEVTSPQHEALHTRRVLFLDRDYWLVHDHVRGDTDHLYEARWHLPAEADGKVTVVRNTNQTTVSTPAGSLLIPARLKVEIEPGWVSPGYGLKQPAPIVVLRARGTEADIVTVLSPGKAAVTIDDNTDDGSLHSQVTRGKTTDLIQWAAHTDVAWERWHR